MTNTTYSEMRGTRAPVRMWIDELTVEHAALQQVRTVADMKWVHGVALMPDCHVGKGATVGSVIAMKSAVSPATVGVDIGCGMNAVRLHMSIDELPDSLAGIRSAIEAAVPVGMSAHTSGLATRMKASGSLRGWDTFLKGYDSLTMTLETRRMNSAAYKDRVLAQLGTLGGGNHFIELCVDGNGELWLMLHSGSRNVGKELAERHIEVAKGLPHNADLPDRDLAVFLAGSPEMDAYLRDLRWAQEYARRSRAIMMGLVYRAFCQTIGRTVETDEEISCHHNYVSEERYDGLDLVITRKGAISTEGGRLGCIPGSMGTGSYIVQGLANEDSFCSASHGAGRKMSRGEAKRRFTTDDLAAQTAGVECRKDQGVVDEIPGAYKDLEDVMSRQRDLVVPVQRLRTLLCVKG